MDQESSGARPKTTSGSTLLGESGKNPSVPSLSNPAAASSDKTKPKASAQAPNYGSFKKPEDKPLALPKGQRERNPLLRKALANRTKELSTGEEPQTAQRQEGGSSQGTDQGKEEDRWASSTRSKTDRANQPITAAGENTADPEDRPQSPSNGDPEPRLDIEDRLFYKLWRVGVIYFYVYAPVYYIVVGKYQQEKLHLGDI